VPVNVPTISSNNTKKRNLIDEQTKLVIDYTDWVSAFHKFQFLQLPDVANLPEFIETELPVKIVILEVMKEN
jgi:hypothetical protein